MESAHDWVSRLLKRMPVKGTVDYRCFLAASWRIDFPASEFGEIFYHVILGGSAVLEDPEPAHRLWGWSASCAPNPPPKIWAAWRHSTGLLSGRRL